MKITIVAIMILVVAINVLVISFRRKHIQRIKMLEKEKNEIQHKPIFEEMTKIKQLNMTGETEENFEAWRAEWTKVIDIHMPEIDQLFFDAEEQIDRFKLKKIKETITNIELKMALCQKIMTDILSGLDLLIGSEEKNRVEMEELRENHRIARKKILAHQPAFGVTIIPLEQEIEAFNPKFTEYDTLTDNGNYLQAREIVIELTEKGQWLFPLIEEMPALLADLQSSLPATIRELRNGIREMEGQYYYVGHLELTKKLGVIEKELEEILQKVYRLEMDGVLEEIGAIHQQMDGFYDALEKEVMSRHVVENDYEQVHDKLIDVTAFIERTLEEATYVQQSYRLPEQEAEIPKNALEEIEKVNKSFSVMTGQIEGSQAAYSSLETQLKTFQETATKIEEDIKAFAERIQNLRNDELKVQREVGALTKTLHETDRSLQRANIPGIPSDIAARLDETAEHLYVVRQSLEEIPLNMTLVYSYLENAKRSVEEIKAKVEELLENAVLIETIIQYGNRFRRTNTEVDTGLTEAEASFKQFRYAKALEEAATAVEAAEPGAMKRIEALLPGDGADAL